MKGRCHNLPNHDRYVGCTGLIAAFARESGPTTENEAFRRKADVKRATNKRQRIFQRLLAVMVSLPLATAAYAECSAAGCYEVLIEELYPTAEGGVWIKTTGDETLANCTANANVFLRLNVSAGYKDIYSTLLAAMLAEKRVNLRVVEGSNPCAVAYVTLNRISW
jgi:hypothetical protein